MADTLLRALALGGRARVFAAVTTDAVEELRRVHRPTATVTAALGRVATGALLLAACLEKVTAREPMLTLEVEGGGPAGRLVATASPRGWLRALVTEPGADALPRPDGRPDVAGVVGTEGHLVVTRDPGIGEPYRGVVPLVTAEIATDIAHYLVGSEQTPAAVVLGVATGPGGEVLFAGGYTLHLLPGVSDLEADRLSDRVRELGPVSAQLEQGSDPRVWLATLFPDGLTMLDEVPVTFLCGCSRDRVERALLLLGRDHLEELLELDGDRVELTCEFCRTAYALDRDELEQLVAELGPEPAVQRGT
jgi:molecular chaperone Hsp33